MNISIIPMEESHLESVANLEQLCFSHPWSLNLLKESTNLFWVAIDHNTQELLGYLSVSNVIGEGYVGNVAVSPQHRHCGIASQMLQVLLSYGRAHLDFLTLEVRESNLPAIALYQKHQFETVATRKNYYDDPKENALIMTLHISKQNSGGTP